MVIKVIKVKRNFNAKQARLSEIQQQLTELESEIERYTQLSKEGKESTTKTQQQLHQNNPI